MPSSTAAVFATRWNACCDALEELDDNLVGESGYFGNLDALEELDDNLVGESGYFGNLDATCQLFDDLCVTYGFDNYMDFAQSTPQEI